ncbi:MAG: hypothetical protein KAX38_04045, partial [Candidatus Krumholzibacteria bacterium]|nr:hypothetical protein [Candidatus Krumholzibacteria bacterium]
IILMVFFLLAAVLPAAVYSGKRKKTDRVRYEKYYRDPILKIMKEEMDSLRAVRDSITSEIKEEWKEKKKKEKEEREIIRFDFEGLTKPRSPEEFKAPFHFPPAAQYYTGTCWSFCTTSFIESEVKRLTGRDIRLSEIYTVYWEYVEKARGFVRKRGNQPFVQGSESDAVFIVWDKYGIVPATAYTGLVTGQERHNHKEMAAEMRDYLELVDEHGYWDEDAIVAHIRQVLDRYLGRPPEEFDYNGETMTPKLFLKEVLRVNIDDYVQFMSTLSEPFYTQGEFKVHDNWRPTDTYYNVPLDEFYECIKLATKKSYTVCIGGDVSEPGYNGFEDAAIVPAFDIPQEYIDQDSREFRFFNKTTDDDHGIHLLAHKRLGGRDWFLIKDSARSARHGKYKGYYFYRDDY